MLLFFKYGEPEHIDAFFENGSVQIGTVRSYDEETFGSAIGDNQEGFSTQTLTDSNIERWVKAGKPIPNFSGFPTFRAPGSFGNMVVTQNIGFNYAIYSMSHVLHRDLCTQFSRSYGAAIFIHRPFVFLHELSLAFATSGLVEEVDFQHVADVKYRSRQLEPEENNEDVVEAFIKEPSYAMQREVRAIWNIGKPEHSFYRFKAPKARRACRLIRLDDMPSYNPSVTSEDQSRTEFLISLKKSTFPDS